MEIFQIKTQVDNDLRYKKLKLKKSELEILKLEGFKALLNLYNNLDNVEKLKKDIKYIFKNEYLDLLEEYIENIAEAEKENID